MAGSRLPTAHAKTTEAASTRKTRAPAAKHAPATTPTTRPSSARGRTRAAEMLREIQIDGKALSDQIERLRHRFL